MTLTKAKKFFIQLKNTRKGKRKITEEIYLKIFSKTFPEYYHPEINYKKLKEYLKILEQEEKIRLPKSDRHWNYTMRPTLPNWIILELDSQVDNIQPWRQFPWCVELRWISQAKKVSKSRFNDLKKLDHYFKNPKHFSSSALPIKERSLEIFDDEKKLNDSLLKWKLFTQNITIQQLNCYTTNHPFPSKSMCQTSNHRIIIIENRDTFDSFWRCNEQITSPPYQHIVYGHGKAIEDRILWVNDFDSKIRSIEYFGDIDIEGFRIPYRTNKKLIDSGLPQRIVLSNLFYSHLIQVNTNHLQFSNSNNYNPRVELMTLKSELQIIIEQLLQHNQRIAQESLSKPKIQTIFNTLITNSFLELF